MFTPPSKMGQNTQTIKRMLQKQVTTLLLRYEEWAKSAFHLHTLWIAGDINA